MIKIFAIYAVVSVAYINWMMGFVTEQAAKLESYHETRIQSLANIEDNDPLKARTAHSLDIVRGFRCSLEEVHEHLSLVPAASLVFNGKNKNPIAQHLEGKCKTNRLPQADVPPPKPITPKFTFTEFSPIPDPAISSTLLGSLYCSTKLIRLTYTPEDELVKNID